MKKTEFTIHLETRGRKKWGSGERGSEELPILYRDWKLLGITRVFRSK